MLATAGSAIVKVKLGRAAARALADAIRRSSRWQDLHAQWRHHFAQTARARSRAATRTFPARPASHRPNCSAELRPPVSGSVRGPVGVRNVAVIRRP